MYDIKVLIQGYPGRSLCHGGLGWSTTTLLRGGGRVILVDVGAFGVRHLLRKHLQENGVQPEDVTDVVLTHAHYDHAVNFTLFPKAAVWIGDIELDWAAAQPPGFNPLPELYVRELTVSPRVRRVRDGETFLPGLSASVAPGHTPGHLLFHTRSDEGAVLFTGDAAKNRAELLSGGANDTYDPATSSASIARIWEAWRREPGTLLVPGHDLAMRLDAQGRPYYLGERRVVLNAWFGEDMEPTQIDLSSPRCSCGANTPIFPNSR